MSRQIRNIVISLAVVVVLAAGLLLLRFMPSGGTASSSSAAATSSSSSINLIGTAAKNIKTVHMTTTAGQFTIRKTGDSTYKVDELSGLPLSDVASGIFTDATTLTADRVIEENASDLKQYGLADSKVTVDLTDSSGKTYSFVIGSASPSGSSHYICVKGSTKVYLTSSELQNFTGHTATDLLDKSLLTLDTTNLSKLSEITFGGSSRKSAVVLKATLGTSSTTAGNGNPTFEITSPSKYDTNTTNMSTLTNALAAVSADDVASLDVSAAGLAKYGLKNPAYTFSMTYSKKTTTLLFGNTVTDNGSEYVYVMMQGRNIVYRIQTSTFPYYKWSLADIASRLPYIPDIDDIKTITVTDASGTYKFNLTGTSDALKVTYNSKTLSTENFRKYYEALIGVQTEDVSDQVSGTPLLTVKYEYRSIRKAPVTVQFIPIDDRRVFYSINGKGDFYALVSDINNVIGDTQKVLKGTSIS